MTNTNVTRSENPSNHVLLPYFIGTLFYTVLADGRIDVTFHEYTKRGNLRRAGQRYTIARSWAEVLPVFAPRETVRVVVRAESVCASCGAVKPVGQSCICFDNGCQ